MHSWHSSSRLWDRPASLALVTAGGGRQALRSVSPSLPFFQQRQARRALGQAPLHAPRKLGAPRRAQVRFISPSTLLLLPPLARLWSSTAAPAGLPWSGKCLARRLQMQEEVPARDGDIWGSGVAVDAAAAAPRGFSRACPLPPRCLVLRLVLSCASLPGNSPIEVATDRAPPQRLFSPEAVGGRGPAWPPFRVGTRGCGLTFPPTLPRPLQSASSCFSACNYSSGFSSLCTGGKASPRPWGREKRGRGSKISG